MFFHPFHLSQQVEQLSSIAVLHAEDEVFLTFKGHVKLSDEGMVSAGLENGFFVFDNRLFGVLEDEILTDDFDGHHDAIFPS